MRGWIIAIVLGIAAPAAADTCASDVAASESPPESAGCAVRPGVGALASLGMSIIALGLATRRRPRR
jgi:hypothetical protein